MSVRHGLASQSVLRKRYERGRAARGDAADDLVVPQTVDLDAHVVATVWLRVDVARLPDGQDRGLIAVAVNYPLYDNKMVWIGYIIELTRDEDGRVHVDLDHPWVPEGAQIVQVDYLGIHLTDAASGDRFTMHEDTAKKHGLSYVPNGNLLMRCLAGLATLDEVRAAAQAHVEEKSARERLAEIESELAGVKALAAEKALGTALDS